MQKLPCVGSLSVGRRPAVRAGGGPLGFKIPPPAIQMTAAGNSMPAVEGGGKEGHRGEESVQDGEEAGALSLGPLALPLRNLKVNATERTDRSVKTEGHKTVVE